MSKLFTHCSKGHLLSRLAPEKRHPSGSPYCNTCKRENRNPSKGRIDVLRKYNLTVEMYDSMLNAQDGKCAICGSTHWLGVDHSHASLLIRGIICRECNLGLGYFGDSVELMQEAIAYLRKERS